MEVSSLIWCSDLVFTWSMSKTMKCHSYCSCVLMFEPGTIWICEAVMLLTWLRCAEIQTMIIYSCHLTLTLNCVLEIVVTDYRLQALVLLLTWKWWRVLYHTWEEWHLVEPAMSILLYCGGSWSRNIILCFLTQVSDRLVVWCNVILSGVTVSPTLTLYGPCILFVLSMQKYHQHLGAAFFLHLLPWT